MVKTEIPSYAVFEDYRSSQRIAVVVRWFLLFTFLALVNFRSDEAYILAFNAMGAALIVLPPLLFLVSGNQWKPGRTAKHF